MAGRKIRPYESEVSWRDFKPLAPSKRSKALQKELERRRPHAGVGTRPWQAKRAGYMAYEKAGSRAKRRRYSSEFVKEWEGGVKSARFTEYKFRYPSERDLERKAQEERKEREKYQLRRRLERLEREPRRHSGYSKWFHGPENPFRARKNPKERARLKRPQYVNEAVQPKDVKLDTILWRVVLDRQGFPVAAIYFNGREFSLSSEDMEELQDLIWKWADEKGSPNG